MAAAGRGNGTAAGGVAEAGGDEGDIADRAAQGTVEYGSSCMYQTSIAATQDYAATASAKVIQYIVTAYRIAENNGATAADEAAWAINSIGKTGLRTIADVEGCTTVDDTGASETKAAAAGNTAASSDDPWVGNADTIAAGSERTAIEGQGSTAAVIAEGIIVIGD